jgi:DHA1 family bicyclomycin/chloramphenicol resistance-like MFS transporter
MTLRRDGQAEPAPTEAGLGRWLPVVLGMLTIFGPVSVDLYLPSLPQLRDDLQVAPSLAQITLTACLIGLAAGQLIVGPMSDRFGRRRPLLIGLGVYIVAAVLCSVSASIEMLIAARFVQGLAGATGMVIAQASGRDRLTGPLLTRYYGSIAVITGSAAFVGPLLGGQLAALIDWRGTFLVLAGVGAVVWLTCALSFTESLPAERRVAHGRTVAGDLGSLLRDRGYAAPMLVVGLTAGALFAYVSGAAFVLQETFALSPQQYSFVIAGGAALLVAGGLVGGRAGARWSPLAVLPFGLVIAGTGAATTTVAGFLDLGLPMVIASILLLTAGGGLIGPSATALALQRRPEIAGSAAATLGVTRYGLGALAAPLVGAAGSPSTASLGIVTLTCVVGAAIAWRCIPRTDA